MGKYYDTGKPFSIDNWNTLIQDVNEILENPPEGSECEPLDPLDEVTDPHIWAVEDVEEVREALEETCPEIAFDTDLILWKYEIIDEIEEQMVLAWCNCEDLGPIEYEGEKVSYIWLPSASSEVNSDGYVDCIGIAPLCGGPCATEITYTSPWHDAATKNSEALAISQAANILGCEARNAAMAYAVSWRDLQEIAGDIDFYQGLTDTYTTLTQSAIDDYEACMLAAQSAGNAAAIAAAEAACEPLKDTICTRGEIAKTYQEKVNGYVSDYTVEHPNLEVHKTESDTKAQACFTQLLTMEPKYPVDKNLISEVMDFFDGDKYAWDKLIVPVEDGDMPVSVYSLTSSDGNKVMPFVSVGRRSVPTGYTGTGGYFFILMPVSGYDNALSPGGYPFVCGRDARAMLTDAAIPYYQLYSRHFCDQWAGNTCEGGTVPACTWGPITDYNCVTTIWGGGFCAEPSSSTWINYQTTATKTDQWCKCYMITSSRQGHDYTVDQEDFHNTYMDWFTEHIPYDDRHDEYC